MEGIQEITEIIEAYSGAFTHQHPTSNGTTTTATSTTVIGQTPSETIRRSIEKSFGEPRVSDYSALAYLSMARSAWRSSQANTNDNTNNDNSVISEQCTSVIKEVLTDCVLRKKCAASVLNLSVDILAEVAATSPAAKQHITAACMAAFTTYAQGDSAADGYVLDGAPEVAARFFSGRAAVEAVVGAVCAEGTTQRARRMLVRVALGPLVEREEGDKGTLEAVWESIIGTNDTQTILMVVGQLSKVFLGTHFESYAHRRVLWDTIYAALKNSANDLYAKNCAIFLIGKYAECCGNPHEKELWDSFIIIWEAIGTHATELIKPAWKRLESIVRPGRDCYLEPRWPMLLFYCALNHYHVPIRRVLLVSFLTHGAYSVGVLATNVEFLEGVVFKMFCDQALYKGELRPFSGKLIVSFLDSFFALAGNNADGTTAANIITAYLNALSSAPIFGSSLIIRNYNIKVNNNNVNNNNIEVKIEDILIKIYTNNYKAPTFVEALEKAYTTKDQVNYALEACMLAGNSAANEGKLFYNFTKEDAMAVALYTFDFGGDNYEINPYRIINKALMSNDEAELQKASGILYAILSALRKLPRYSNSTLYRGIRDAVDESMYKEGSIIVWHNISSTSPSMKTTKAFLANSSTAEETGGTLFVIDNAWGYNIQPYSLFPEEEEIILEPERRFKVQNVIQADLTIIKLEMIDTHLILPQVFGSGNK